MKRAGTIIALVAALLMFVMPPVEFARAAAPTLPALGSSVQILTFHLSGQYTAATYTGVVKFNAPYAMRVLYVQAVVRAQGGTQGTTTVQVKNAGSNVTNAMDLTVAAGTVVEASTYTNRSVAKDAAVTADLVISGGSSPTINDVTILMVVGRR